MPTIVAIWNRLPVVVQALVAGLAAAIVGTGPWAVLSDANIQYWPEVPWAIVPSALYLWLYWRWIKGAGWPRSTARARRINARVNGLSEEAWAAALFAGTLGLAAVVLTMAVVNRMVRLPEQPTDDLSQVPWFTLVLLLVMTSIVAGVVEETSFRGYMQAPIERRHGPIAAILVTGGSFGLLHFTHPEVTLALMPYYMAIAAVYGALAWLTNSILPSAVLHAGGNMLGYIDLLTRGRAEWQASSVAEPLVWETGADASFWISSAAALAATLAAIAAYVALARVMRSGRRTPTES